MSNISHNTTERMPDSGQAFLDRLRNLPHAGAEINLLIDYTTRSPDVAMSCFMMILKCHGNLKLRALALQGLGWCSQHNHIRPILFDGWNMLQYMANELRGQGPQSSDLTKWASGWAIQVIGYSQDDLERPEAGNMPQEIDRICNKICENKLEEIGSLRLKTPDGLPSEKAKDYIEFWTYAVEATSRLFNCQVNYRDQANYREIVWNVIDQLHSRGVFLGLGLLPNAPAGQTAQELALHKAKQIFKESQELEDSLYEILEAYLHNNINQVSFRKEAAEILATASNLGRKITTLTKLLVGIKELRMTAIQLLNPFKHTVEAQITEPEAKIILDILNYNTVSHQLTDLKDLSVNGMNQILANIQVLERKYNGFVSADDVQNWKAEFIEQIKLTNELQSQMKSNTELLMNACNQTYWVDLEFYHNTIYNLYDQVRIYGDTYNAGSRHINSLSSNKDKMLEAFKNRINQLNQIKLIHPKDRTGCQGILVDFALNLAIFVILVIITALIIIATFLMIMKVKLSLKVALFASVLFVTFSFIQFFQRRILRRYQQAQATFNGIIQYLQDEPNGQWKKIKLKP